MLKWSRWAGPRRDVHSCIRGRDQWPRRQRQNADHGPGQTPSRACTHQCLHGLNAQRDRFYTRSRAGRITEHVPCASAQRARCENSYAGAVVEFDDTHDFFLGKFPMEYRASRPKKDIGAYVCNQEPVPISEFCTKPIDWKHEAEVRVVRSLSDCRQIDAGVSRGYPIFVMDIPPECVTAVVMGERMSIANQRSIWKMVKSRNISLHLDAISNWDYKFRREEIRRLGMSSPIISPRTAHIFSEERGTLGELARFQLQRKNLAFVNDTL